MTLSTVLQAYSLNRHITLKNRIIMAPMTRNMADDDLNPTAAMVDYYVKRAAAGLIISEGIIIRPDGKGYSNTPGLYTPEHIAAWRRVTDGVHAADGHIFAQLWHVGRVSHPHFLEGQLPLSASATSMTGSLSRARELQYGETRAASIGDIQTLIDSFAHAADNALKAGFDGIELHGANGYLIDQFLHYDTNKRDDHYGGTPENMTRLPLAIIEACSAAIGAERIGLRLSPAPYVNQIGSDDRDAEVFRYLLNNLPDLAYVHSGNFDDTVQFAELGQQSMSAFLRANYRGRLIACGGYQAHDAQIAIDRGDFDLVAIGRPFIANPDLIEQISNGQTLQPYHDSMLSTLI